MRTQSIVILVLLAGNILVSAQSERYVTMTAKPQPPSTVASNSFTLTEGEAAEVISFANRSTTTLTIEKDGASFSTFKAADDASYSGTGRGTVIKGPATFLLFTTGSQPGYVTLRVLPEAYPPDKTLIVAPSTNQFQVTLESSTNLVNWSAATNGIYGSPDEARFFRIHLNKLN